MTGAGLSLMGGALAQNEAGIGEMVYFPAGEAQCKQKIKPHLPIVAEDIHRAFADEQIWFHHSALFESLSMFEPVGGGAMNVLLGDEIKAGGSWALKAYHYGASLDCAAWYPNKITVVQPTPVPATVDVQLTFNAGAYHWSGPTLGDIQKTIKTTDIGSDESNRNLALYNSIRSFRGLSYKSRRGGIQVHFLPMADGLGHYAIWSTYSQTLTEI